MKKYNIKDFTGGWFVGHFDPAIIKTNDFEVAIKEYKAGVKEPKHVHKIATEITVIVSGRAKVNGQEYKSGEVFLIEPGEYAQFETLEPTVTAVVKTPSVKNDKFISEGEND